MSSSDEHRSKETGQKSGTRDNEKRSESVYILEVSPTGINDLSVKDQEKKIFKNLDG